jgi:hypothetical protein
MYNIINLISKISVSALLFSLAEQILVRALYMISYHTAYTVPGYGVL